MSIVSETTSNGQVYAWLSLPPFTAPSSCSQIFQTAPVAGITLGAFYPLIENCQAPALTTWLNGNAHTTFSLSPMNCPAGYTTASSSTIGTAITAVCCPSNYFITYTSSATACISYVPSGAVLTVISPANSGATLIRISTLTAPSTVGGMAVWGTNVAQTTTTTTSTISTSTTSTAAPSTPASVIASTSSPIPSSASVTPASVGVSTSRPIPSSAYTTPTSASTPIAAATTASNSSNAFSTAAMAGIGIGISLGVIGIAALIVAMCLLKRRKKRSAGEQRDLTGPYQQFGRTHEIPEPRLEKPQFYEMQSRSRTGELPGNEVNSPVELEGNLNRYRRAF